MSIPVFRRFSIEDVPGAPQWIDGVFQPLNVFCDGTVQAFTKNLVLGQNVQGQKFSTKFLTPADYATGGFNPIKLSYTGGGQPNCLMLGSINNVSGTPITTAVSISNWNININVAPAVININYIAGLAASTNYYLTVVAL